MPRVTDLPIGYPVTPANAASTILYAVQTGASRQLPVTHLASYIQTQVVSTTAHVVAATSMTATFDTLVVVTATPVTITLPVIVAADLTRRVTIVHRASSGTVTIAGASGQQINGAATMTLTTPYATATLVAIEPIPSVFEWVRL